VKDANLFVAILADDKLLVISLVEYKAKMGTEMKRLLSSRETDIGQRALA
jgi:hypothetical protein